MFEVAANFTCASVQAECISRDLVLYKLRGRLTLQFDLCSTVTRQEQPATCDRAYFMWHATNSVTILNTQHSTTVDQWLHQECGTACHPQSEPLRHCRRFIRNWRPISSGLLFSDFYLGRSLTICGTVYLIALVAYLLTL